MSDKKYYLDFGPELIKLLGPNLYTNIYYVLGEIIANAYDADANNVYIIYNNNEKRIIVEDDGTGMTYEEFNEKYLKIGTPTRGMEGGEVSKRLGRPRMGRKGIGKLSALSVSDRIVVMSSKDGQKSGCVLSMNIKKEDDRWTIPSVNEEQILFRHISEGENGSAIVMEDVKYSINKTIESAKRNISRLFPFISKDFRIHLEDEVSGKTAVIEDNVSEIVKQSDALITFSDLDSSNELDIRLSSIHDSFDNDYYYRKLEETKGCGEYPPKKQFHRKENSIVETLDLINNQGEMKQYSLVIKGWVATYRSVNDKKSDNDFPVNYISLISHGKLGRVDILPEISLRRQFESYVVGQFFIDLLEDSSLPDIAASNRQGYREDDQRYVRSLELIREKALRPITNLKVSATNVQKEEKQRQKEDKLKVEKEKMDKAIQEIVEDPVIKKAIRDPESSETLITKLKNQWEIKTILNEQYKKLMISHSSDDKLLIDELEKVLLEVGFTSDEIIYTSSTYMESRPGMYEDLYEYLREFFVNTYKRNDLCVLYIINKGFNAKWNTVLEAGAGWVIRTDSYPFYTDDYSSINAPLNKNSHLIPKLSMKMDIIDCQNLAQSIQIILKKCGKEERTVAQILDIIKLTKLFSD